MLTKRGNTVSKLNWTETKIAVKFGLLWLRFIMNQNFNFYSFCPIHASILVFRHIFNITTEPTPLLFRATLFILVFASKTGMCLYVFLSKIFFFGFDVAVISCLICSLLSRQVAIIQEFDLNRKQRICS